MKKFFLAILIAALLIGAAIYDFEIAIALAILIACFTLLPCVLGYLFILGDKWDARMRAKRIKKIRERESERQENIERIIREVPQERFSE